MVGITRSCSFSHAMRHCHSATPPRLSCPLLRWHGYLEDRVPHCPKDPYSASSRWHNDDGFNGNNRHYPDNADSSYCWSQDLISQNSLTIDCHNNLIHGHLGQSASPYASPLPPVCHLWGSVLLSYFQLTPILALFTPRSLSHLLGIGWHRGVGGGGVRGGPLHEGPFLGSSKTILHLPSTLAVLFPDSLQGLPWTATPNWRGPWMLLPSECLGYLMMYLQWFRSCTFVSLHLAMYCIWLRHCHGQVPFSSRWPIL